MSDAIGPPSDAPNDIVGFAIDACKAAGVDPYPIMADALRDLGWLVEPPWAGPDER